GWEDIGGGLAGLNCGTAIGAAPFTDEAEIHGLAARADGTLFGVSNGVTITDAPIPPTLGGGAYLLPAPPIYPGAANNAFDVGYLVRVNGGGSSTRIGMLQKDYTGDIDQHQIGFDQVGAMEFDDAGNLWAIAYDMDKLPGDDGSAAPGPVAYDPQESTSQVGNPPQDVPTPYLIRIDTNATVDPYLGPDQCLILEQYAVGDAAAQITTMAFERDPISGLGYFYVIDANGNELKILQMDGALDRISPPRGSVIHDGYDNQGNPTEVTGMVGLELDEDGTLYGVAGGNLYEVVKADVFDPFTGGLLERAGFIEQTGVIGFANIESLAYYEAEPEFLWGIESAPGGNDILVRILKKPPKPTDPYSIYIAESDAYTDLRMAIAIPYTVRGVTYYDDLRLYNAPTTPYLGTVRNVDYYSPADSGGVLVGGWPAPAQGRPYRFTPVTEEYHTEVVEPHGVFPGGELEAGIHVAANQLGGWWGGESEMGHFMIGGTLAGHTTVPGSAELIQVGLFYGNIEVGHDLRAMYVHTDAGSTSPGPTFSPENSVISVGGTLTDLYVRNNLASAVVADGLFGIPDPTDTLVDWNNHKLEPILEHEGRIITRLGQAQNPGLGFTGVDAMTVPPPPGLWADSVRQMYLPVPGVPDPGELYDVQFFAARGPNNFETVQNNTWDDAQYLASESGSIIAWALMDVGGNGEANDYFSVPLMAGQTVRLSAYQEHVNDPRAGFPMPFPIRVYDSNQRFVASYGYETIEDQGVGSRGVTLEDLVFTAPSAGLYYLEVQGPASFQTEYTIFIQDATPSTVGGVRVTGNYSPGFVGPELSSLYVGRGNLGAVNVDAEALGVWANVERGSLVTFEAERLGIHIPPPGNVGVSPVTLVAMHDIGRVQSHASGLFASAIAGANTGHGIDNDAHVQNVISADGIGAHTIGDTTYIAGGTISASGSIGRVYGPGDVSSFYIFQANSDGGGPATSIDMIEAGGDWGDLLSGPPELLHGVDGNVRFMQIGGDIYGYSGGYISVVNPTVHVGQSAWFADDGGGVLFIGPGSRKVDSGEVDFWGRPIYDTIPTTYSYTPIAVDDAVGGVMANLVTDGSLRFAPGNHFPVEISDFELEDTDPLDDILIEGGPVDIY
ncbi:hypothetical protein HQ560_00365, partial [bacterium]|nr:hypothetical protein [bacterium]